MSSLIQHILLASVPASVGYTTDFIRIAEPPNISVPRGVNLPQICAAAPLQVPRTSVEKWLGRTIYFIVTDRFARSDPSSDAAPTCVGKEWCGGTFRGVQRKLDYIQNMGFDAIWITPVVKQVDWRDKYNGTAYHGYWASDFYEIDPHLGTEDDFLALKAECTRRGMLLMLDVVANHAGPISHINQVEKLGPHLNHKNCFQFHQLYRGITQSFGDYIKRPVQANDAFDRCWPDYEFGIGCNPVVVIWGWIGDLADLNQESPETCSYLTDWIHYFATKYRVDGFRLDTAVYMPKWFLRCFQNAAGTFMIGEVRTESFEAHRSFSGALTGLLNFPVTFQLAGSFGKGGSMKNLQQILEKQHEMNYPDENLLGNFLDNHDQDRFLYTVGGDVSRLKNGLAWTMLYHGIPIIYQGTEQVEVANMANEPETRRSLWPDYSVSELYNLLAQLSTLRKEYGFAAGGKDVTSHAEVVLATSTHLAFTRGQLLVLLTNIGQGQGAQFCLNLNLLPLQWTDVCHKTEAQTVLGNVSDPECVGGKICLKSMNGCPSIFALTERPVLIMF